MARTIAIVGRGRLGRTLAPLLARAGHAVVLRAHTDATEIRGVDTVLLCVPDGAIAAVAAAIPQGPVVAHCAGSQDLAPLAPHADGLRASLHPLMTFPGPDVGDVDLHGVPAAIDGGALGLAVVRGLAADLGLAPVHVAGDRRLYHAAAVMAGNFATILLLEAGRVLSRAGVEPTDAVRMLAPLAAASIRNTAAAADPRSALTGPIARGDQATLDAHRSALVDQGLEPALAVFDTFVKHGAQWRPLPDRAGGQDA